MDGVPHTRNLAVFFDLNEAEVKQLPGGFQIHLLAGRFLEESNLHPGLFQLLS
jgi:hypothetical protein